MKQAWTVYTAEDVVVIGTRWTDGGPQESQAISRAANPAEAESEAQRLQRNYDRLRAAYTS